MDELVQENQNLKEMAEKYHKQMIDLREIKLQHENEIDTLLKFNEKLLSIIQKQLNGQNLKKSDILSLQPISEKTEVESQMFQSQFSNLGSGMGPAGSRLLQKKSLNLRPDPIHQRINRPEPLAIVQRQEQLSIDVDGMDIEANSTKEDDEIVSLIKQFRKKIKVKGINGQASMNDISQKIKTESEQLNKAKRQTIQQVNRRLQKLNNLKQRIVNEDVKDKLVDLLMNGEADYKGKTILTNYIKSL